MIHATAAVVEWRRPQPLPVERERANGPSYPQTASRQASLGSPQPGISQPRLFFRGFIVYSDKNDIRRRVAICRGYQFDSRRFCRDRRPRLRIRRLEKSRPARPGIAHTLLFRWVPTSDLNAALHHLACSGLTSKSWSARDRPRGGGGSADREDGAGAGGDDVVVAPRIWGAGVELGAGAGASVRFVARSCRMGPLSFICA
jgi:hypothetical protein